MKWHSSIKSKLTALMLGMIVLSLLLAAALYIVQLGKLQKEAGHSVLASAHRQAQRTFSDMEQRLAEVSGLIVSDQNVIAGIGLIVNYEDRSDYQSLVFEPPKQELTMRPIPAMTF